MAFAVEMAFKLLDGVTPSFQSMIRSGGAFESAMSRLSRTSNKAFGSISTMAKGFIMGNLVYNGITRVGQGISGLADDFGAFDIATRRATSTWDEVQKGQMSFTDALVATREISRKVSEQYGYLPSDVARGMDALSKAGYNLKDVTYDTMSTIGKLAQAGDITLQEASDGLTASMSMWGIAIDGIDKKTGKSNIYAHANLMAQAAAESKMSIGDLLAASEKAAALYSQAGGRPETFYPLTMALSDVKMDAEVAGTALAGIQLGITKKSATGWMDQLGVQFKDGKNDLLDMLKIVEGLREKLKNVKGSYARTKILGEMFDAHRATSINTLISMSAEEMEKFQNKLMNFGDPLKDQADVVDQAWTTKIAKLRSAVMFKVFDIGDPSNTGLGISIDWITKRIQNLDVSKIKDLASKYVPIMTDIFFTVGKTIYDTLILVLPVVSKIWDMMFKPLMPYIPQITRFLLITVTGLLAFGKALFLIKPLLPVLVEFAEIIGVIGGFVGAGMFGGILLIIGAVVFLATVAIKNFISIKRHWSDIVQSFQSGSIVEGFMAIGRTIIDMLLNPLDLVIDALAKIGVISEATHKRWEDMRGGLIPQNYPAMGELRKENMYGLSSVHEEAKSGIPRFAADYAMRQATNSQMMYNMNTQSHVVVEFANAPAGTTVKSATAGTTSKGLEGMNLN